MAEIEKSTVDNNVRKLRKKLRQIENLQRLCGVRELSDEESAKVSRRDEIRAQLQDLLSIEAEEEQIMQVSEDEVTKPIEKYELGASAKNEAEQDSNPEQKLKKEKQSDCDEDLLMESENGCQENVENRQDTQTKQEIQHGGNVAEDKKIEKIVKKRGDKRMIGSPSYWKEMHFSVRTIKGHHHPLCAVDFNEELILSGGHDTSLKIWNVNTYEEIFSLGGHTGRISAILLLSGNKAVTGSQDCSIRFWDVKTEGGKIDIYDLEKGTMTCSTRVFDDPVVSLAFTDGGELACASADSIKKYGLGSSELIELLNIYENIDSIVSFTNGSSSAGIPNTSDVNTISLHKVNCIAAFKNNIFWGDDGFNVKAYEVASRKVVKLRNNLTEYSPTDAMTVLVDGDNGYLFCSGFDIDRGRGYINVRQLPHMDYLGTISDQSLGHISCIAALMVDGKLQIITGGSELRVWNEASNGKKRRASDELSDIIPYKFVKSYITARDSEEESEEEIEDETTYVVSKEIEMEKKSWCVVQ